MKTLLAKMLIILFVAVPVAVLVMASKSPREAHAAQIARGKYLVTYGGCNDCHTPLKLTEKGPQPDFARLLSGHPENAKLPPPPRMENNPWFAATAGFAKATDTMPPATSSRRSMAKVGHC